MINEGVQNEMAACSHQFTDENYNPNIPPTPPPPQKSANALIENDLVWLANLLQSNNMHGMDMSKPYQLIKDDKTNKPCQPKIYT